MGFRFLIIICSFCDLANSNHVYHLFLQQDCMFFIATSLFLKRENCLGSIHQQCQTWNIFMKDPVKSCFTISSKAKNQIHRSIISRYLPVLFYICAISLMVCTQWHVTVSWTIGGCLAGWIPSVCFHWKYWKEHFVSILFCWCISLYLMPNPSQKNSLLLVEHLFEIPQ